MAKIIIQSDEGQEVAKYDFPAASAYALTYMPGCPVNMRVHNLLNGLKSAIDDAIWIDQTGQRRPLSPSAQAMNLVHNRRRHA